jgi:hypothetical protein
VAHYSGTGDCVSVILGLPYNKLLQKVPVTFCHVSFTVCLRVKTVLPYDGFLCGIYVEIVYVGLNLCRKGEATVVPVHTIKAYGGCRGIAPLILKPVTRWSGLFNFVTRLL